MGIRDDFSDATKRVIAGRAGHMCSAPDCGIMTVGPHPASTSKTVNLGVAAHISAASMGGPRYDTSLTQAQRKAPENGIWLCQNHAHAVDAAESAYEKAMLINWKNDAEAYAARRGKEMRGLITNTLNEIDEVHVLIGQFMKGIDIQTIMADWRNWIPYRFDFEHNILPHAYSIIKSAKRVLGVQNVIFTEEEQILFGASTNFLCVREFDKYLQQIKAEIALY